MKVSIIKCICIRINELQSHIDVSLSLSADSTIVSEGLSFNVCVSVTEPNDIAPHFIPVSISLISYPPTQGKPVKACRL